MLKKILSTSIIVLLIGLVVSVTGLFKEIFVAYNFGTNSDIDIFYLGLSIPLFIVSIFSSSINATVIPAYLEAKSKSCEVDFFIDVAKITAVFLLFLSLLSAIFIIYVQPSLLGLTDYKIKLVIQAGLIMSPIVFIQGVMSFLDGVLNAEKKIIANNLTSILIPLGTIAVLQLANENNFLILCLGLYVGYGIKLLIQLMIISKIFKFNKGELRKLDINNYKNTIQEFFWLVFSSSILGIMPVIANYYASFLDPGSVASLNYANKLISSGLMIVGIVINSVLFPYIAEAVIANKSEGIRFGLRITVFGFLLFSVAIIPIYLLSDMIVQLFFERGEFTHESTLAVSFILKYLLLYIPFYVTGLLLSRLVVSLSLSRIFILGNIISLVLFSSSSWILIQYYNRGIESLGIAYTIVYSGSSLYKVYHILKQRRINAYKLSNIKPR